MNINITLGRTARANGAMRKKRNVVYGLMAFAIVITLAACGSSSSVNNDQKISNNQLNQYQRTQPVPFFDWSQYRQTAIDIETAQAQGVTTTTFFYNMGSNVPIKSCPSIGFPIASTAQLTNPEQAVSGPNNGAVTVAQLEPNGVYTGTSSGTYVVCVTPAGAKEITYWEGWVETEGGPAHYDTSSHQIVLDGPATVTTKTKH